MPGADDLMMRIYAAMAQKERELISERTRAALAAAKARGAVLGGDRGYRPPAAPNAAAAAAACADEADRTAHRVRIKIKRLRRNGTTTLVALARELTALDIPTPRRGCAWTHTRWREFLGGRRPSLSLWRPVLAGSGLSALEHVRRVSRPRRPRSASSARPALNSTSRSMIKCSIIAQPVDDGSALIQHRETFPGRSEIMPFKARVRCSRALLWAVASSRTTAQRWSLLSVSKYNPPRLKEGLVHSAHA